MPLECGSRGWNSQRDTTGLLALSPGLPQIPAQPPERKSREPPASPFTVPGLCWRPVQLCPLEGGVRPASGGRGRAGRNALRQGCLGTLPGPETWLSPTSQPRCSRGTPTPERERDCQSSLGDLLTTANRRNWPARRAGVTLPGGPTAPDPAAAPTLRPISRPRAALHAPSRWQTPLEFTKTLGLNQPPRRWRSPR